MRVIRLSRYGTALGGGPLSLLSLSRDERSGRPGRIGRAGETRGVSGRSFSNSRIRAQAPCGCKFRCNIAVARKSKIDGFQRGRLGSMIYA